MSKLLTEYHKHTTQGLQSACKRCINAQSKENYRRSKARKAVTVAAWQAANPEKVAQVRRDRQKSNPQEGRDATRKWKASNRAKVNAYKRAYRHQNPAAVARHEMRRRTAETQASVSWGDKALIADLYKLARIASRCTGMRFEVDHMLPLRGKRVSGLHVEHNLTVLSRHENAVKSNRVEID